MLSTFDFEWSFWTRLLPKFAPFKLTKKWIPRAPQNARQKHENKTKDATFLAKHDVKIHLLLPDSSLCRWCSSSVLPNNSKIRHGNRNKFYLRGKKRSAVSTSKIFSVDKTIHDIFERHSLNYLVEEMK